MPTAGNPVSVAEETGFCIQHRHKNLPEQKSVGTLSLMSNVYKLKSPSAAFSATIMVGMLVLPRTTLGITEASTT